MPRRDPEGSTATRRRDDEVISPNARLQRDTRSSLRRGTPFDGWFLLSHEGASRRKDLRGGRRVVDLSMQQHPLVRDVYRIRRPVSRRAEQGGLFIQPLSEESFFPDCLERPGGPRVAGGHDRENGDRGRG